MLPHQMLTLASAAVIGALGLAHLLFTFSGNKLLPRDPALQAAMEANSPRLTSQTTMWRAWIGFNASHSMGALLFALVYGYLALRQPAVLAASVFLRSLGLVYLLGYLVLGWRYWFSTPFRGIALATLLFAAALVTM
jgi:hypothetical protein